MNPEEFAAKRRVRFTQADDELRELVREALSAWNGEDPFQSADLQEAVEVIWLEHFTAEAPRADYERFLPRFRQILTDSLGKTSAPTNSPPSDHEVNRVTTFLGTLAVNDGTMRGAGARGVRFKRWTSMHDPSVRHSHDVADGQIRPILDSFLVEGVDLQYPGQPVGPPEVWINCRCVVQPAAARGDSAVTGTTMTLSDDFDSRSQSLTAAADDEPHTGVGIFLIPTEDDPIVAASSEQAHLTTIWMGAKEDLSVDLEELEQAVRFYAQDLDGPVVVPVKERGTLGDEDADVVFLEPTESLLALRDGFLVNEPIKTAHAEAEQFPEWTPHVTLGYPETPAAGEYDGDAVTFDRVGLWIGPEQYTYPMGDPVSTGFAAGGIIQGDSKQIVGSREGAPEYIVPLDGDALAVARMKFASIVAAGEGTGTIEVVEEVEDVVDAEMPLDELEDGEEEVTEIPVHGVATIEGRATGDGRGFKLNALDMGAMPQPLGYEYVSTHGGDTSHVAIVGRIDEYWREEVDGIAELRWKGVILTTKEYASRAIESILDGSYTGLSVIVDSVELDVEEEREELRARVMADMERDRKERETGEVEEIDFDIDAFVDEMVGDGKFPTTWFSHARVRRFDMVPTGAYQEAYIRLGHEFIDDLTPEQIEASAQALEDCGCGLALVASADAPTVVVDLTQFSAEEQDEYDALSPDEQAAYARDHNAIIAAAFAPGTKDGPGWITHPQATSRIRRYWVSGEGAAKIAWGTPGDFNRCRAQLAKYVQNPEWLAGLCANMHKEATGTWPNPGGKRGDLGLVASAAPLFSLVASADPIDASFFKRRELANPRVGVVVEGDAVYGYIAQWNVCHVGNPEGPGRCTLAPRSASNYGQYRTGTVQTTEGPMAVGQITMNTGHAGGELAARTAVSHYDNTGAAVADVVCGEDAFGIWFAGRIRPTVSDDDRFALAASGRLSGDWRTIGGAYELVAALVVNVPGFPIPEVSLAASADLGPTSIVAAGVISPDEIDEPLDAEITVLEGMNALSAEDIAGIAIAAAEQVFAMQRRQRITDALAPARAAVAKHQLAAARSELATLVKE
ncbi:capsid maturation protease [Microbacterium phage Pepe25]|nr:capsid maturation protease [Microbacterium phage Pepe25]